MNEIVTLSEEQLRRLADLVAERLAAPRPDELIGAAELAKRLGRSRDYVYTNADRLGALRLGDGPRPRLMFQWPLRPVTVAVTERQPQPVRRHVRPSAGTTPLLPIRGAR